ncbi:MAG: substrate-binding domain-containing protein [Luteolibacter sp.]
MLATKAEQVAALLREGMHIGRWRGWLPGRGRLAKELGCSHGTVEAALQQLVREGLLVTEGAGKRRRIVLRRGEARKRVMRVRILLYEQVDRSMPDLAELLARLQEQGYAADFALKSLKDLGMQVDRVASFVKKTPADAWVVAAGSREILEWFAHGPVPALAMFGRFSGLPIASSSPRIAPAMVKAVRRLAELGHRRIVMLSSEERHKPFPAIFEQIFLDELKALGLPTGPYNLPDWPGHANGLRACLDALFKVTPPTALICGETRFFAAAQQYLARRGIHAPEHVSLICSDPDPAFEWCDPAVSHFCWDRKPVIKRVVEWVDNVAKGKDDRRQMLFDGEFVEGGTIGPAGKM